MFDWYAANFMFSADAEDLDRILQIPGHTRKGYSNEEDFRQGTPSASYHTTF